MEETVEQVTRPQEDELRGGSPHEQSAPFAVVARDLGHSFESQQSGSQRFTALEGFNVAIPQGKFVSIVGPSGCGKSTLLNLFAGLIPVRTGSVLVKGEPITGLRDDVGFVFQNDVLLPWKTVIENVRLGLKFRGAGKAASQKQARDWVHRVGLSGFEEYYPRQLSGGMRKRVQLAATLACESDIILMDEPFSALDAQTRSVMENDLLDIWASEDRITVIFVTHDLDEAISLSDEVVVMTRAPGTVKSEYEVSLPRPRNVEEIRSDVDFTKMRKRIWADLKSEVDVGTSRARED